MARKWKKKDDDVLKNHLQDNPAVDSWSLEEWEQFAESLFSSGGKTIAAGLECRTRWNEHVKPSLRKLTEEEEETLLNFFLQYGSKPLPQPFQWEGLCMVLFGKYNPKAPTARECQVWYNKKGRSKRNTRLKQLQQKQECDSDKEFFALEAKKIETFGSILEQDKELQKNVFGLGYKMAENNSTMMKNTNKENEKMNANVAAVVKSYEQTKERYFVAVEESAKRCKERREQSKTPATKYKPAFNETIDLPPKSTGT